MSGSKKVYIIPFIFLFLLPGCNGIYWGEAIQPYQESWSFTKQELKMIDDDGTIVIAAAARVVALAEPMTEGPTTNLTIQPLTKTWIILLTDEKGEILRFSSVKTGELMVVSAHKPMRLQAVHKGKPVRLAAADKDVIVDYPIRAIKWSRELRGDLEPVNIE